MELTGGLNSTATKVYSYPERVSRRDSDANVW